MVQSMLTRSPRDWYNHTRNIYRWPYSRLRYWEVARFQFVSNTASDKRLLLCLDSLPTHCPLITEKVVWTSQLSARRRLPAYRHWVNPNWRTDSRATAKITNFLQNEQGLLGFSVNTVRFEHLRDYYCCIWKYKNYTVAMLCNKGCYRNEKRSKNIAVLLP